MIQWQRQPQVPSAIGGLHLGLNSKRPYGTEAKAIPVYIMAVLHVTPHRTLWLNTKQLVESNYYMQF